MLLETKLGDLKGKLGYREVVFKRSWGILFGHFVAFAARNAVPQKDQDFKWVSASYGGSIWVKVRLSYGPVGAVLGPIGANFGDFGAMLKAIWDHFRPCYFGIFKNNPKLYLQNALPSGLEAQQKKCKKLIKNQNLLQNANLHGSKGKT